MRVIVSSTEAGFRDAELRRAIQPIATLVGTTLMNRTHRSEASCLKDACPLLESGLLNITVPAHNGAFAAAVYAFIE
jgi:hypothetical protein